MPKRNDGNEQDLRVRPELDAHSLEDNNPFTGAHPPDVDPCVEGYGEQIDIEVTGPDGSGQIQTYDYSYILGACEQGMDNRSMNLLIMRILKSHFSNPSNIFNPRLKAFVYSSNPALTKIRIAMNTNFTGEPEASILPAIILKRLAQKRGRIVIGDTGELREKMQGIYDFTRVNSGAHRLLVIAQGDGFMEDLAEEVFYVLTCLGPYITTWFPIMNFETTDMGEIGFFDTLGRTLAIPIDLSYAYEYSWTLRHITPELTSVNTAITAGFTTPGTTDVSLCPNLS